MHQSEPDAILFCSLRPSGPHMCGTGRGSPTRQFRSTKAHSYFILFCEPTCCTEFNQAYSHMMNCMLLHLWSSTFSASVHMISHVMLPRLFTSVRLSIRSKHVKTEAIQVVVYQKWTCHCYTSSPHDRGAIKQLFTKLNLAHHVTNTNTRAKPSMSYYRCEHSPASFP